MIEELRRFLLVTQEGTITRAAQKSFITQSALTQSIHRLEKELRTELLRQTGKQIHITEDGKSLAIIGEKMLNLWANAHNKELRNTHIPAYSVGMFDNVALRLGTFLTGKRRTKLYNLELTIDSSGKLLTRMQLGTLDAALCIFNETYHLPAHVLLLKTYSEKLIPVSSKLFQDPEEKVPFILYNRGSYTRMFIDEMFVKHGIVPTIYAESTSVTFMRELALLGYGVALLPENFIKDDLDQGRLKKQKMPMQWSREYGLFIQKNIDPESLFIKDLQTTLKNLK